MTDRFQQSRKEKALSLDDVAEKYYCEYWDVEPHQVGDLEGAFDGEYDASDAGRVLQWVDFTGIDKLVDRREQITAVGQRFRPASEKFDVDFSFRVNNGMNRPSEYTKCLTGFREQGIYPNVYAFGIVAPSEDAFEKFVLIDMRTMLLSIDMGRLEGDRPGESDDGKTEAVYYSLDDLREVGCVLQEWDGPNALSDPNTPNESTTADVSDKEDITAWSDSYG